MKVVPNFDVYMPFAPVHTDAADSEDSTATSSEAAAYRGAPSVRGTPSLRGTLSLRGGAPSGRGALSGRVAYSVLSGHGDVQSPASGRIQMAKSATFQPPSVPFSDAATTVADDQLKQW